MQITYKFLYLYLGRIGNGYYNSIGIPLTPGMNFGYLFDSGEVIKYKIIVK